MIIHLYDVTSCLPHTTANASLTDVFLSRYLVPLELLVILQWRLCQGPKKAMRWILLRVYSAAR